MISSYQLRHEITNRLVAKGYFNEDDVYCQGPSYSINRIIEQYLKNENGVVDYDIDIVILKNIVILSYAVFHKGINGLETTALCFPVEEK